MSGSGQLQMQPLGNYPFNPMASQQAQAPAYDVVNKFLQNWMQGGSPGAIPGGGTIPGIMPMPAVAPVSTGNAIYQAMMNPPKVAPVPPVPTGYIPRGGVVGTNPPPPASRGGYLGETGPVPYIEMPSATQILPGTRGSYPVPYPQMPAPANPVPYIEMPSAVQIPSIFNTRY